MSNEGIKTRKDVKAWLVTITAVVMSLFHLYTAGYRPLTPWLQRNLHLMFALVLVFLLFPTKKGKHWHRFIDYILIGLSMVTTFYIVFNMNAIVDRAGMWNSTDVRMGMILILIVLEATRRVTGNALPMVAITFLLYGSFGRYIPGVLGHRGYSLHRISSQLYLTLEGLFGVPLGVSATYVFLFILFGAFLESSGIGHYFINLAYVLTGKSTGGPAKTAVIASGLMGSISGSAVANVVTTGAFTIPLMKRVGYKNHFAGAVEAVASSGGQIMPPIMGAAAFIIAEFLSIPYLQVASAAFIPAMLFFLSVGAGVHFEAKRLDLKGVSAEELPDIKKILKEGFHLFIPLIILLYLLIVVRYTPTKTAFWTVLATVAVSWVRKETRMDINKILQALEMGARNSLTVVTACACAGLVIGIVSLTGIGLRLSTIVIELSGGHLLPALILAMFGSIILGMGLPTTAAYIIMATLGAPALIKIGVVPLAAHLFVFYFAIVSAVTPPVALAAYCAAAIADANVNKTAVTAMKVGLAGFVVPFMFVYSPQLLLVGSASAVFLAVLTAVIGVVSLSAGTIGFINTKLALWERASLMIASLLLIKGGFSSDIIGFTLLAAVIYSQYFSKRALSSTRDLGGIRVEEGGS
ncbi:MAG: TRAP transporter permease [Clostridiales bacterium]|nr:TRAP transporter permease [Clostridiales bacterium]